MDWQFTVPARSWWEFTPGLCTVWWGKVVFMCLRKQTDLGKAFGHQEWYSCGTTRTICSLAVLTNTLKIEGQIFICLGVNQRDSHQAPALPLLLLCSHSLVVQTSTSYQVLFLFANNPLSSELDILVIHWLENQPPTSPQLWHPPSILRQKKVCICH